MAQLMKGARSGFNNNSSLQINFMKKEFAQLRQLLADLFCETPNNDAARDSYIKAVNLVTKIEAGYNQKAGRTKSAVNWVKRAFTKNLSGGRSTDNG